MNEGVMRKYTLGVIAACIVICCCLLYLPQFTVRANHWIMQYKQMREEARKREEMTALDLMKLHEKEISEQKKEEIGEAIRMAFPDNISYEDIKVKNDYRNRCVEVFFPDTNEDILNRYPIVGSTNHIKKMEVRPTKEGLYVEYVTDEVVEPVMKQKDNYCYLTLKDPHDVYDRIIVVDPGHGGGIPGTIKDGAKEKSINLQIVKKLKKLLDKEPKTKVYYTRESDIDVDLQDRVKLANEVSADLFLSVHQNALGDAYNQVKGTQVLYQQTDKRKHNSKKFAKILLKNVTKAVKSENKGLIKGNEIYIIRSAKMPVALVEVGFVTNREEQKKLLNDKYQKKVAKALYISIKEAYQKGL